MSEIRVENIIGETGVDAVNFTKGINVTGTLTSTNVSVASSVTAGTHSWKWCRTNRCEGRYIIKEIILHNC